MENHPDVFVCGAKVHYFKGESSPVTQQVNLGKDNAASIKGKFLRLGENTRIKNTKANYQIEDMESYRVRMFLQIRDLCIQLLFLILKNCSNII